MKKMVSCGLLIVLWACGAAHLVAATRKGRTNQPVLQATTSSAATQEILGQSQTVLPDGCVLLLGGTQNEAVLGSGWIKSPGPASPAPIAGHLKTARAWHSATLLPNGTVLVFGGIGPKGVLASMAEIFDPAVGQVTQTLQTGVTLRTRHTATLLISGKVLFVGGVDDNNELTDKLELWDSRTQQVSVLPIQLRTPRSGHTATLQADGSILVWGGVDKNGSPLSYGEVIDPVSLTVRTQTANPSGQQSGESTTLMESQPADGATDVPLNSLVSFRFSQPLNVTSVTNGAVVLSTDGNVVPAKIIPAEGGMLLFITPQVPLLTGTAYTATLNGLTDSSGQEMASIQVSFTTVGLAASAATSSASSADQSDTSASQLPPLQAPKGVTALAGQVVTVSGNPLVHVLIEIDSQRTYTDATGRFLLQGLTAGHHVMIVDGASANSKSAAWGLYRVGVDLIAARTTALKYTVWMTPLDTKHVVRIPSPTTSDVAITNPDLPGLEIRIPAHTIVKDTRGRVVTQLGITPISVNKPPFPLRPGAVVPIYFTLQPGGTSFITASGSASGKANAQSRGVQVRYQNPTSAKAGARFNYVSYDPFNKGWFVYGKGRVSSDQTTINPDAGTQIWTFDGTMLTPSDGPPAIGSNDCSASDGDSVDLLTGLFTLNATDLYLPGTTPLSVTRMYRQGDGADRSFGVGSELSDNMYLSGDDDNFPEGWTYQDLNQADGSRVHFTRVTPCGPNGCTCDSGTTLVYVARSNRCHYGAVLTHACIGVTTPQSSQASNKGTKGTPGQRGFDGVSNSNWVLTMADGTVYGFPGSYDFSSGQDTRSFTASAMADRNGNWASFNRDGYGNLLQVAGSNGRSIQFGYDDVGHINAATDSAGRSVSYGYDAQSRLSTFTDAGGFVTQYTYDANDNLQSVIKPDHNLRVTNTYDQNGRVLQQTFPDGSAYQFAYTTAGSGNVLQTNVTDPSGSVRQVTFNSDGHATSETVGNGTSQQETTTYELQPVSGLMISSTDALGRKTLFTYDSLGETTSITRLAGTSGAVTTYYGYPPLVTLNGEPSSPSFGSPTSIIDPLGNTTQFSYDGSGNLQKVIDPFGNTSSMTYNAAGQMLTQADALGNTTVFGYDSGDLTSITDPLNRTTSRFLDAAGRLLSITDPAGRTRTYTYTAIDQLSSVTDPLGNQTSFTYYPNGTLHTVTDANQHSTIYTHDNMDRLQSRHDPLGNSESYQYDANSRVQWYTDRRGAITGYRYDSIGRRVFAGFGYNGSSYDSTISYTFDPVNRLTDTLDSLSGAIHRTFDGLDGLLSEATPQGSVSYTYDADERRKTMTVAGQSTVQYTFDGSSRLTQIAQNNASVSFVYDAAGRRSSLTLPNGVVAKYGYDQASQLSSIQYYSGSAALGELLYAYDLAGRRTAVTGSFARTNLPNAISGATYNQNNQLTHWDSASHIYDLNGNLQNDGINSYSWNSRNQLASMNGGTDMFAYDSFGRRIAKSINGSAKAFLYDGANIVQELQGGSATASLLTGGIDEVFLRTDSSGTWNFVTDALGSTIALGDNTGQIQTQYSYGPFGNTTSTGLSSGNRNAYTGRELDETGIYYNRARYYDPQIGRFLSEDKLGLPGRSNLYLYTHDSPTNFEDPFGLKDCKKPCDVKVPPVLSDAVDTLLGEESPNAMIDHNQYQYGDAYGKPTGKSITEETLDSEAYLIASSMVNRGNQWGRTLDEVVAQGAGAKSQQYSGYTGDQSLLRRALASEEGSPLCIMLHRALDALMSAISDPGDYLNYRAQVIPGDPPHVVGYKGLEWVGRSVFGVGE